MLTCELPNLLLVRVLLLVLVLGRWPGQVSLQLLLLLLPLLLLGKIQCKVSRKQVKASPRATVQIKIKPPACFYMELVITGASVTFNFRPSLSAEAFK